MKSVVKPSTNILITKKLRNPRRKPHSNNQRIFLNDLTRCDSKAGPKTKKWKLEIARWFSHLPTRYFTGSPQTVPPAEKERTLGSFTTLRDYLSQLPPDNPETGWTIILSSYTTWQGRSMEFQDPERATPTKPRRKGKPDDPVYENTDDVEVSNNVEEQDVPLDEPNKWVTRFANAFHPNY